MSFVEHFSLPSGTTNKFHVPPNVATRGCIIAFSQEWIANKHKKSDLLGKNFLRLAEMGFEVHQLAYPTEEFDKFIKWLESDEMKEFLEQCKCKFGKVVVVGEWFGLLQAKTTFDQYRHIFTDAIYLCPTEKEYNDENYKRLTQYAGQHIEKMNVRPDLQVEHVILTEDWTKEKVYDFADKCFCKILCDKE